MSHDPDIDYDDELAYEEDEDHDDLTVTIGPDGRATLLVDPTSPMGILASYHETERQTAALIAANDRTMARAPGVPPVDARELTFAEVATGSFPDLDDPASGPWVWPEPVCIAMGDSADFRHEFGIDTTVKWALMMRGLATLYAHGYRLHGPPVISAVSGGPTDDEAAGYLAGRGLDPTGTTPPEHGGTRSVERVACGRALREQWPDLTIPAVIDLVDRLANRPIKET